MLTGSEAGAQTGISSDKLFRVIRAAGFPEPGLQDRVISRQFLDLIAGMVSAENVFGEEAVVQLIRVMGAAMARLADAMVSAFLVNVEPVARAEDPAGLAVARANAEAAALLPAVSGALDVLLREHLISARRTILSYTDPVAYETQRMCVGFVDLVGSTALAQTMTTKDLGGVLTAFEHTASDAVISGGGRVVKLIGDEVLFTAGDETSVCQIALRLADIFTEHPTVPPVRAGVAGGDVLLRDGDVFGPVVNLAARAAAVARAGEVVATTALAATAGLDTKPLGRYQLKGFADGIELCRLLSP